MVTRRLSGRGRGNLVRPWLGFRAAIRISSGGPPARPTPFGRYPNSGGCRSVPGELAIWRVGSWRGLYGGRVAGDGLSEGGVAALAAVVRDGALDGLFLADQNDSAAGSGDGRVEQVAWSSSGPAAVIMGMMR